MKHRLGWVKRGMWVWEDGLAEPKQAYRMSGDVLAAAYYFKMAAAQGHTDSQYQLARMLVRGEGLKRNDQKAVEFLTLAAKKGHAKAQEGLGLMYRQGLGVEPDAEAAARWLRKAADQRDPEGAYVLGCMLRSGEGIKKDLPEAVRLFEVAADRGHAEAAAELAVMHLTGEGTDIDEEGARFWLSQADLLAEKEREEKAKKAPEQAGERMSQSLAAR
ncbi:unnamed protein product [Prorocentrum cordatum]|uniref:Sel1 repeat family protein n=1 Tax=Prorocentrum cordatum TaxID=2364126 RepID=A0ABN9VKJ0_9DINO|nr:unnamed protein product [Polarella glacialis]